jgi:hypothetical protein
MSILHPWRNGIGSPAVTSAHTNTEWTLSPWKQFEHLVKHSQTQSL